MASLGVLEALSPYATGQMLATVALGALLSILLRRRYFSPISDVPGPFFASLTRLWQAREIILGRCTHSITALHRKNGPFVRIAPGEVSVSHPEAPRKLLLATLPKGRWYKSGAVPDWRFQNSFSSTDPAEKNRRSRAVGPAYSTTNVLRSEAYMDTNVAHLLRWMDDFATSGRPMELDIFLTYTAYDLVGELTFSKPFGFIAAGRDIGQTLAKVRRMQAFVGTIGWFEWLNALLANPFMTWLGILPLGIIFNHSAEATAEREKNADARFDMVAQWLDTINRHPDRMNMTDLRAQVLVNIGAGAETVSGAIQNTIYHMIRKPGTWQRARAEIQASQARGLCRDRIVSYADALELPYTQACFKEAMRVFSLLGMGLPRVVPRGGVTIGDRTFAEGTTLSVHVPTMMLDEDLWGPDASEYKPERWLEDEDIAQKEHYWMPFGLGYASCSGQHLARVEIYKIISTIIRDYSIRQVNPEKEWQYDCYFGRLPREWPVFISKV